MAPQLIADLYKSGFSPNIVKPQRSAYLINNVTETPVVSALIFQAIQRFQANNLKDVLKHLGWSMGLAIAGPVLHEVKQSLQQEYLSLGYYLATVDVSATTKPQNRVALSITINEGKPAIIKR